MYQDENRTKIYDYVVLQDWRIVKKLGFKSSDYYWKNYLNVI